MKRVLFVALMPLLLCGAFLTPIGADLQNGSGGFLFSGKWQSREAMPQDDGSVLFIAKNYNAGFTDYTALLKNADGKNEILRPGYIAFPFKNDPNNNWNVIPVGRNGVYATISYFNTNAFFYVSDGSAGIYALMVEGLPFQDNSQLEEELSLVRVAASGDGKVVMAQIAGPNHGEMNVFKRGENDQWTCTAKEMDVFTAELYRGIALNYDGTRLWHFTQCDKSSWLAFTDMASDGTETTVPVMKVDDGTQHSYYVACADNGKIVYFTSYLNGVAVLMKGVYDMADGSLKTQIVSLNADNDSRSPVCSADGRFVAFASKATNLTADAVNGTNWQIFVYDSLRNEIKLMSKLNGTAANADCETPAISANGRYVTFTSAAKNLGIDTSETPHLYKAECENINVTQGVVASETVFERIAVNDDGGRVVFSTTAVLDVDDNNTLNNVYQRDTVAGVSYAVSPLDALDYRQCAISGDGNTTVYVPFAGDDNDWPGLNDFSAVCSLALDFDGDVLAYMDLNGRLIRQERGHAAVVLATDATNTTGAASAVRLSHDGNVLIYTCKLPSGRAGLKAWFAETEAFTMLTEDSPQYVHLSQSGRWAYYRKSDRKLYRLATTGGESEVVVDNGDIFVVSRDGRYAYHDSRTNTQLVRQELFGNHTETVVGDSNGTRYSTIGVSADGAVVYYVSNGSLVYDALQVANEGTITITGTCVSEIMENTGDNTAYEIALTSNGNADYALRLVGETSAQGGSITLLYPNGTRPWYALNYTPKMYFCGTDTVAVELWNGREWLAAEVEITVLNVNNPPEWTTETIVLEVSEGNISRKLKLGDFIIDHDLDYSGITGETIELFVEGPEAGELLCCEGDVLNADLTGRYDLVARGGGVLEYAVTATDKAGEKAVITLQLNVANTDLPPNLSKISQTAYEGLPIEWSWFDVSDPDAEDMEDNLRLCFQSSNAEFYGNDGKKLNVGDGVYKNQFPITYRSTCNIQQDMVSVWAKDLDGLTSETVTMAVEAAYIEVSLADLYGGYDAEGRWGWKGVTAGWNMLSVPCDVPEENMEDYKAMMGLDVIWRWNGRRFEEATSLRSDEGFWGYITALPDEPQGTLAGRRTFSQLRQGWNLRGAYGASLGGGPLWMLEKARQSALYARKSEAVPGLGHWIFTK